MFDPDTGHESVSTVALFKKQSQNGIFLVSSLKADKSDVQYSPYSQKQELDEK